MVLWVATDGTDGHDPFATDVNVPGPAHPRPPAGERQPRRRADAEDFVDLTKLPSAEAAGTSIADRQLRLRPRRHDASPTRCRPSTPGSTITFDNLDAPLENGIWHTITVVQGAVQRVDRHRLPAGRRRRPVRLRRARRRRAAHRRPAHVVDARRPRRRAPTRTSAGSTRSCGARSESTAQLARLDRVRRRSFVARRGRRRRARRRRRVRGGTSSVTTRRRSRRSSRGDPRRRRGAGHSGRRRGRSSPATTSTSATGSRSCSAATTIKKDGGRSHARRSAAA